MAIETTKYVVGQEVDSVELNAFGTASTSFAGGAIAAIIGAASANTEDATLTVVPGSGMHVVAGGTNQKALCQGKVSDYLPATTLAIAASDVTNPRIDLISFQYADVDTTSYSTNQMDASGVITPLTGTHVSRSAVYQVTTGTPTGSPSTPATPGGYVAVATVLVPAGSSTISGGNITMVLPRIGALIKALVSAGLISLNGLTGALTITSTDASVTITPSGSTIDLHVATATPGVATLHGKSGTVDLLSPDSSIDIATSGNDITIQVNSTHNVKSINGLKNTPSIASADGTVLVSPSGSTIDLSVQNAPPAIGGAVGAFSAPTTHTGNGNFTPTISLLLPAGNYQLLGEIFFEEIGGPSGDTLSIAVNHTATGSTTDSASSGFNGGTAFANGHLQAGTGKGGDALTISATYTQAGGFSGTFQYWSRITAYRTS